MSYHLVIEGVEGTRRVREGAFPRRGEWLSLEWKGAHLWLPVLEVCHALSRAVSPRETEGGSDLAHERSEAIVITSLALAVRSHMETEDAFRFVLPPSRWPFGGFAGVDEDEIEGNGTHPIFPRGTKPRSEP